MSEFVSREEFENLKSEVAEIKEDLSKSSELLKNIDKRTDVILEKLNNLDKVSNMQIEPLKKDINNNTESIKELKANSQWTWRTIASVIIGIVIKIIFETYFSRVPWLLILMISAAFTQSVISSFEGALSTCVVLTAYIPMIMSTGGNSGSQASTMIIRGMSVGEVEPGDILKVMWKELRVGVICGLVLGLINYVRLMLQYPGNSLICLTVVISIFFTVILAKTIGCVLPIVAKVVHLDPAIMAAPMITTIVDTCSMMIYFQLACWLLDMA